MTSLLPHVQTMHAAEEQTAFEPLLPNTRLYHLNVGRLGTSTAAESQEQGCLYGVLNAISCSGPVAARSGRALRQKGAFATMVVCLAASWVAVCTDSLFTCAQKSILRLHTCLCLEPGQSLVQWSNKLQFVAGEESYSFPRPRKCFIISRVLVVSGARTYSVPSTHEVVHTASSFQPG